jgi:predicted NAD/FAD-binding protein
MLPQRRRAWASWNYYKPPDEREAVSITYCMNRLQSIRSDRAFCVTLNRDVSAEHVIRKMTYDHPVYDHRSFAVQGQHERINGVRRTYYCGAYWGYGFHEDGVRSALRVLRHFDMDL